MRTLLAFAGSLVLLFCSVPSKAADITSEMRGETAFISIRGEIDQADVGEFQRLALKSDKGVVVLASPGGALKPALEIGKIIQLKGFGTYAPPGQTCTSACALIWVAGQPRMVSAGSRVGFHAGYTVENGHALESGVANAMIGRYLTLLNLPERAIVFATEAAPSSANWLNTSSSTSGITFDVIEDTGTSTRASSSALNSNSPVIARSDFSWSEGVWGVTNTKDRDGCLLYAEYEYEGNLKNKSSIMIAKRRHDTTARLSIDNEKFRSLRQGDTHAITVIFYTGEASDAGWGERSFRAMEYSDGGKGLYVELEYNALIEDIRNEESVSFFKGGKQIDGYPLKGSAAAVRQFERCLADGVRHDVQDPFR